MLAEVNVLDKAVTANESPTKHLLMGEQLEGIGARLGSRQIPSGRRAAACRPPPIPG